MTSRVRASILAVAFAVIVALPSIAAAQSKASIGVKAGVNFAKLKFDQDNSGIKGLAGAVAGLFVSKSVNDSVGWRLEGLFSQKGAKFQAGSDTGKFKLSYFDIPLLLTAGHQFTVFTGPQVSFKTKAQSEENGIKSDAGDEVKSTDFGWVLGAGVASGRLSADVRYTLGLTDIAKDSDKVKNRVFAIMVGVKLGK